MGLRLGVLLLAFTAFAVGPILQPRHLGFSADASKSAVGSRNAISARTRVCCQLFSNKKKHAFRNPSPFNDFSLRTHWKYQETTF